MNQVLTIKNKSRMKKKFLFGFLMLALVTLLSGMVQANNVVAETTIEFVSIHSPPAVMPTVDLNVILTVPANTWYCTINPGYIYQQSANVVNNTNVIATNADVLSTNYINLSKLSRRFYASDLRQNDNVNVNYRHPRDGLRQSWQA